MQALAMFRVQGLVSRVSDLGVDASLGNVLNPDAVDYSRIPALLAGRRSKDNGAGTYECDHCQLGV
jgi:hypothetical protein